MPFDGFMRRGLHPISSALTSNRILWYSLFSTLATTAAIANACRNYSNFYSVAVYLSRSGRSLLVLANFGFIVALTSGRILQRIFFGPLQAREVERLYDQTWMFVTESLLAFTIFRDDFDIPFVIMFGFLLFIKCFHWLMADRVESMDQVPYPGPPLLFHIRLNALFFILWLIDIIMLLFAIESTLTSGVGGAVLFANEYAILTAHALNSIAKYVLSSYELRRARSRGGENAPAWENKSMYVFYIELVTDFLKLSTYLTFFAVVLSFYGLPLNIIRDVYLTARSFITRLRALVRYHNATRDMDRRYPNATEEELAAMSDRTCIICRDELVAVPDNQNNPPQDGQAPNNTPNTNQPQDGPNVTPKKLPCGHIFHFQCLRSWLERQQSCPTSRRTVLETGRPAGNAAQAGQRGARQPGQQQQNNVAAQGPPAPGQQQPPQNNGMGWIGRLLGVALLPPRIPNQLANAPVPPPFVPVGPQGQQQLPGNPGWAVQGQQQLPPGYAYVPYYPMHPNMQPPQLQPPPRGFYGPGGAFYAWNPEGQGLAQGQQAPTPQAQDQQPLQTDHTPAQPSDPSPSAAGPQASTSTATNVTRASTAESTSSPTAEQIPSTPAGENSTPTPREAAAQAALRRFYPSQAAPTTTSSAQSRTADATSMAALTGNLEHRSDSTPRTTAARSPLPQQAPLPSVASTSNSVSQPTPTASTNAGPTGATQTFTFAPPRLIPLAQGARAPVLNGYQPRGPPVRHNAITPAERAQMRINAQQATQTRLDQLQELPAVITEEQLGRLDTLTREAIDERLKVLEAVSGTLWRCVGELTRLRSALPVDFPAARAPAPPSPNEPHPDAGVSNHTELATDKGKVGDTSIIPVEGASSSVELDDGSGSTRQRQQSFGLD
ncbi:hypothetical protein BDY19DRAFT_923299 [Irpex rosettiformis]|uniref:Uncharacterized protein n=1 Tax=Irpex rosettiformis TaxID=378272 RepID=A0ACB8UGC1_9APHY|nr:hypothetical protein BDY19DRAFT_923299 [Irpex rosettiformis]